MAKRDWLLVLALTVVYGALAFSFAGSPQTPQTFWRATEEKPSLTLDLGKDVLLDNIIIYTGLDTGPGSSEWFVDLSVDGENWQTAAYLWNEILEPFSWRMVPMMETDLSIPVRFLSILAPEGFDYQELGELALVVLGENGERVLFDMASLAPGHPEYAALFDEQSLVPALPDLDNFALFKQTIDMGLVPGRISDHNNGMIFDEIYHARTAYEHVRNIQPTENSHPPLGKSIISLGIRAFGMTPFGWRVMGILFGVLMLPMLYVFIKNLFDNTTVAACGTALFAFENMFFAQTHISTIDTFVVFFIIAMYLFMYRYVSSGYDAPLAGTLPPLFLCGLSFGLGAATKWTALYAALGLVVLYVTYLVKRGKHQYASGKREAFRSFLLLTLAASVGFFVVVPSVVYTLSYIPYATASGQPLTFGGLLGDMWHNQAFMLEYHGKLVLDMEHPDQSRWWMWMLNIRPAVFYYSAFAGSGAIIATFSNPLVAIGGLVAVGFALFDFFRKKSKAAFVIAVGFLAQLLPWIPVTRMTFAYHYFPSMVFLTLAICYVFKNILERAPKHKGRLYLFTGVSVGLFFLLFPPTAGIWMESWYWVWFAKWLPSWPF